MLTLLIAFLMSILAPSEVRILYDFSDPREATQWSVVNDGVMGGVSDSAWNSTDDGTARFFGMVSLANNGGFCSVRSPFIRLDLSEYRGLEITLKGDGKQYAFYLRDDYGSTLHSHTIQTTGDWQTIRIPFAYLQPQRFGFPMPNAPRLNTANVQMMGIIISDKQSGAFSLELQQVGVY